MPANFESIIRAHGFTPETYDFEATVMGFSYEIDAILLDPKGSPFLIPWCRIYRQPDNLGALLLVDLICKNPLQQCLRFLHNGWMRELRYLYPVYEHFSVARPSRHQFDVSGLTVSRHNAFSLSVRLRTPLPNR